MTIHEALVIALTMTSSDYLPTDGQSEAIEIIIDDHEKLLGCYELCRQSHGRPEAE